MGTSAPGVATLADILALENQPPSLLPVSTYALLQRSARRFADCPALSFFVDGENYRRARTWTYAELLAEITQTANLLESYVRSHHDVVAFVLPNLPETHFVLWGAAATAIVFPINPLLEPARIADLLRSVQARVLVTLAPLPGQDLWQRLAPHLSAVPSLRVVLRVGIAPHLPPARRLALRLLARRGAADNIGAVPVLDFDAARRAHSGAALSRTRAFNPHDTSSYFCTGGTTGAPKIAVRSHHNEISDAAQVAAVNPASAAPGKTVFCGLPLFHVNAGLVTGLVPFSAGGHVVLGTPTGYRGKGVIANFWKIAAHYRINFFSGVPTVYGALLDVPIGDADIGSLEYGLCGAAPMPPELFRRFERLTGIRILEGYGLTEGTCVSAVNPPAGERKPGSVGLRLPLQEMRVVQLDEDGRYLRDCAPDEVGVIAIRGPNVFKGYADPAHERGLWIERGDGPRWLNTGDLGRQDADGYFWLTGRKKELIIRGGHNIDPAAIEAPMQTHEAVELCAAVGRPDAHAGEVPVLYVQLRRGAHADAEALLHYARATIAERAAVPKDVRIVEALPLTAVGKIFKPALRAREIEDVSREVIARFPHVRITALDVEQDARRGPVLHASLRASEADIDALRAALGAYTFGCELCSVA